MIKVLYMTSDGLTDPLAQSQVLPYLKGLSKEGYSFTIISFERKENYKKLQPLIQQICDASNIIWCPQFFHITPPFVSKLYDKLMMKRMAIARHKLTNFSLIHCRSYVASEVGLFFKKKYNVPFLFDMRGLWADERVESGQWNLKKWLYRKIYNQYKKLEREFVIHSSHIVSLTEKGQIEMGRLYDKVLFKSNTNFKDKSTIIPTCADFELFDFNKIVALDQEVLRKKLNILPNQIILSYSGSLGGWYMINEMLLFFKAFKNVHPSAKLLFLTKDKHLVEKAIADKMIVEKDIIVHFSQKKELPLYLSLSNYSIFFIRPLYSKQASSPTKHAELMGLGIPVFCNDIGDTGKLLRAHKIGALVKADKADQFEKIIKEESLHKYKKEEIKAVGLKYFDVNEGIKKYTAVYKNILN